MPCERACPLRLLGQNKDKSCEDEGLEKAKELCHGSNASGSSSSLLSSSGATNSGGSSSSLSSSSTDVDAAASGAEAMALPDTSSTLVLPNVREAPAPGSDDSSLWSSDPAIGSASLPSDHVTLTDDEELRCETCSVV